MPLATAGYNALAGGLTAVAGFASLHSDDPSTSGANELSGGSPAYARKAITWAAASGGTQTTSAAVTFDVPASSSVSHVGLWSASSGGTFYGYTPVGGYTPVLPTFSASTDTYTAYGHGLANATTVIVFDLLASGQLGGLTEGTIYHVISSATDTFQLSTSSGGSAVNLTSSGTCGVVRIATETFTSQGQFQVATGQLTVDARAA